MPSCCRAIKLLIRTPSAYGYEVFIEAPRFTPITKRPHKWRHVPRLQTDTGSKALSMGQSRRGFAPVTREPGVG
jgi:hypothetical protein